MTTEITIALDAMGGANAPDMVLEGANLARQRHPEVRFLMFGDTDRVTPLLQRFKALQGISEVHHADDVVPDDMKPSVALRTARGSSMRVAINAVQEGRAAGVVSSGNTGALMAMAKYVLKTLPGIERPSLASFFPTMKGQSVMLDLGANVDCDADNLVQFAVMGEAFARTCFGLEHPTVGLLNVGAEDMKGHKEIRGALEILRNIDLPMKFHGFIEGDDIAKGIVDVVVTDGFTGNIALKTAEGTARFFRHLLRQSFRDSNIARLGYLLARPALQQIRVRTDPRRPGGAMLLGLNGITIKCHGGSDAFGFANAISVAVDMVNNATNETIKTEFERLDLEDLPKQQQVAAV